MISKAVEVMPPLSLIREQPAAIGRAGHARICSDEATGCPGMRALPAVLRRDLSGCEMWLASSTAPRYHRAGVN
jgi:hypothetical protein